MIHWRWRRIVAGAAGAGAIAAAALVPAPSMSAAASPQAFTLPKITHIWNILLENQDYAGTFGTPSADPYLAKTLPSKGALLENYYGIGHESNDNYLALVAGQPPNPATQADCQTFSNFTGGSVQNGIEGGVGCVYPTDIPTIGNQLTAAGRGWKAYEQDMGNDASRESAACGHPTVGSIDGTQQAEQGDGYATRHDPFVYFHAVIDKKWYCNRHVVALGTTTGAMPKSAIPGETGWRRICARRRPRVPTRSSHRTCAPTGTTTRARTPPDTAPRSPTSTSSCATGCR